MPHMSGDSERFFSNSNADELVELPELREAESAIYEADAKSHLAELGARIVGENGHYQL